MSLLIDVIRCDMADGHAALERVGFAALKVDTTVDAAVTLVAFLLYHIALTQTPFSSSRSCL